MHTLVHTSVVAVLWLTRLLHLRLRVFEVMFESTTLAVANAAALRHKYFSKSELLSRRLC